MSVPSSTGRGALVGIGTVVVERAVAFVVVLVLARTLSPDAFGRYGYILAGMTLVQVMADQGIEVAAVAAMSATPGAVREVLGAALLLRMLVWALIAVPAASLVLPALAVDGEGAALASAGLAASGLVLVGGSISMRGVFRAQGAMGAMARVALGDAVLGAIAVIGTARAGAGLAAIFASRVLASLVVTAVALTLGRARPMLGGAGVPTLRRLARVAMPLAGNALLIAVHTRAGHLVSMTFAGARVVGLLGVAARLTEVLGVLPEGALLAVFPRMAAAPSEAARLAAEAARRLAALALVFVVVLAVGATSITQLLFGDAYAAAGPAVAILAWIALLAVTGGVTLHAVVAHGAERALLPANLVAAGVGVALQVVLVRRLGLAGAALATIATATIGQMALGVPAATRPIVARVWRAVLPLATVAAVVVTAGRAWSPTLTGAIVAAIVYVVATTMLGLVHRNDLRALREALARPRIG